ncbi:MAG: acetyl-CoA decarbonylase/synthase complex subunit gamma [Methanomassiliicoccaceae archaeon]|jgi:acetyl-CoA decarbonylase/synthase complex subunit gamma|nr:acetyl-CoA decarbonylase/synthase complex subunit gamma [Methanomassiliicoccaceae archaeon]
MPTAIEFFKLLPKTNCKDCGQPTCLAFAMLLANQKAKIDDCPHVSQSSKSALEASAAPPIRSVAVGKGKEIRMGGETVLYRHERRFINPVAYAITVSDTCNIPERIAEIKKLSFERVGMIFDIDAVSIKCDSGDADAYAKAVGDAMRIWDRPFVLECDAAVIEKALSAASPRRPLIYHADPGNIDKMTELAKRYSCPLALRSDSMEELADLAEKAKAAGIDDIVLETGASNLKDCIERHTVARRSAIKKKFKPFGYPLMNRVGSGEYAVAMAAMSTMKYGSLVIFDDLKSYEALPLFTLRQNIYTDPQVPIQVKPGLYPIGDPDEHSPIFFTTNFSLTYFTVRADIEKSKVPVWLQIVDTEGLSVLTAYSAGKFSAEHVTKALNDSGVLAKSGGVVVIPGLVARMSSKLNDMLNRKVIVGTTESRDIPKFLRNLK